MSCNWPQVKLGELVEITSSKRVKMADYVEKGVPFFRSKEVIERYKGNTITTELYITEEHYQAIKDKFGAPEEGHILLTSVGTLGIPYQVQANDKFYFKDGNLTWFKEFGNAIDAEYLFYWLTSPIAKRKFDEITIGSTQKALTIVALKGIEIDLPPKNVQKQVVQIVKSLDKKLANNRGVNQTLEQMAQAIFKSWFVDFDPVKAKMNGEQPEGMDAATASLFPEKLVESELGLIPEGWDVGTLSDVAKYCSARTKTDSITLENYISTENMLAEKKGVTAASKLPTAKTVAAYKSGDILVSNIRPYFKKIWLAEGSGGRSNDVLGFESVSANTESYLMNVLYQDTFFEYMTRTSKGAKMPRGDKTAIMNWEMAVPPVELREAFSAIVDKFYQLIPQNRAQNATLESLRDTLLPKLLSGELSLTDSLEVTNV
ncbi:restriction endonuclease subunit S [Vibrio alginolyticus]|uniref:restriction endonuclease subunit S n=1 Tax=Vibrio alginolyticus TaxID=663 RepID=UPI001C9BEAD7|nr:restriction endonuclease subunit S [Vibrio alginolyticus]MBY7694392.1 restriction endonuclease subunit S [Vibrio alginolyticus]